MFSYFAYSAPNISVYLKAETTWYGSQVLTNVFKKMFSCLKPFCEKDLEKRFLYLYLFTLCISPRFLQDNISLVFVRSFKCILLQFNDDMLHFLVGWRGRVGSGVSGVRFGRGVGLDGFWC